MDQPGLGIGWKDDKRLTELDFADDIALVAEQAHVCQQMTANLATHSVKLGLHISLEKTKIIQASQAAISQPIYLGQTELECVDQFAYISSVISKDGDVEKEVNTRLAKAATVFRRLSNSNWGPYNMFNIIESLRNYFTRELLHDSLSNNVALYFNVSHWRSYWEWSCSEEVFCRPSTAPVAGPTSENHLIGGL